MLTEAYYVGLVILATVWVETTAYTGMTVLIYEILTGWTLYSYQSRICLLDILSYFYGF